MSLIKIDPEDYWWEAKFYEVCVPSIRDALTSKCEEIIKQRTIFLQLEGEH